MRARYPKGGATTNAIPRNSMKQKRATAWRVTGKAFLNRESRSQSRTFTIDYGRKRRTRRKNNCTRRIRGSSKSIQRGFAPTLAFQSPRRTPFPNEPKREQALKKRSEATRRDSFAPDQRQRDSTEQSRSNVRSRPDNLDVFNLETGRRLIIARSAYYATLLAESISVTGQVSGARGGSHRPRERRNESSQAEATLRRESRARLNVVAGINLADPRCCG